MGPWKEAGLFSADDLRRVHQQPGFLPLPEYRMLFEQDLKRVAKEMLEQMLLFCFLGTFGGPGSLSEAHRLHLASLSAHLQIRTLAVAAGCSGPSPLD